MERKEEAKCLFERKLEEKREALKKGRELKKRREALKKGRELKKRREALKKGHELEERREALKKGHELEERREALKKGHELQKRKEKHFDDIKDAHLINSVEELNHGVVCITSLSLPRSVQDAEMVQ